MNHAAFIHDDPEYEELVRIVADRTGLSEGIVEKDYWVTHTLWSLQQTGIEISFKGGTSLSKGFDLIQRFSEDVDVTVNRGAREDLPELAGLRSDSVSAKRKRQAFYEALHRIMDIPGTTVELARPADGRWIVVEFTARYQKRFDLPESMRPFVLLETGLRAWRPPLVSRDLESHIHRYLGDAGLANDYADNRPRSCTCVHPFVTLVDKLDSIAKRYSRRHFRPEEFVRHYEDAAQIIRAETFLPQLTKKGRAEVIGQCLTGAGIDANNPALTLEDQDRRERLERAYEAIAPMFWGDRIPLLDCCATIRDWLTSSPLS